MNHAHRIRRLETTVKPGTCPTCHGYPVRIAYVHPLTEEEWQSNMPASGCPDCGKPISQTIVIVVEEDEDGE